MGFENFAGTQPSEQEMENLSGFESGVRRVAALMESHNGDAYEVTKEMMSWVDEAKRRYEAKR